MSDDVGSRTPKARRQTRILAVTLTVVGLLVVVGIAEAAFGAVTRVVDSTGLTCGENIRSVDADDLPALNLNVWETPTNGDSTEVDLRESFEALAQMPAPYGAPSITIDKFAASLTPLNAELILARTESTIAAADVHTGEAQWALEVKADRVMTYSADGTFAVAVLNGKPGGRERTDIITYDSATGAELTCTRIRGSVSSMTVAGDTLSVGAHEESSNRRVDSHTIQGISLSSGDVVWTKPTSFEPTIALGNNHAIVVSSYSLSGGSSSVDGAPVLALDPRDGSTLWEWTCLDRCTAMTQGQDSDGDEITVIQDGWGPDRGFVVLDSGGQEIARHGEGGSGIYDAWVWDGQITVRDEAGLWSGALDASDLTPVWSTDESLTLTSQPLNGTVVIDQTQVFLEGDLAAPLRHLDLATGSLTEYPSPNTTIMSLQAGDGYLIVGNDRGWLVLPWS